MKKILLSLFIAIGICPTLFSQVFSNLANFTTPPVFGASPFQDSLWAVDTTNNIVIYRMGPTPSSGGTITGTNAITMHPHTGKYFVICKQSAQTGRSLGIYDPITGVVTILGNTGHNFSTLAFREDGQLFGVTGDGDGSNPETMFTIDQTNGSVTLATVLGNGVDGEIIAYNYDDDFFYHWSGNGTVVYEKVMSVSPYTVTNIPIIGTTNGETFGSAYLGSGAFLTSNIGSTFNHFYVGGQVTPSFGSNPDDLRGLGLVGRWVNRTGPSTICADDSSLFVAMASTGVSNRHKFQWVLNGVNIPGATSFSYYANQTGWYNCRIILDSLYTTDPLDSAITAYTDTAWFGRSLIVNPLPNVTLMPTPTAYFCSVGDSVQLNSTLFTAMQWYRDGAMIPTATGSSVYASIPGTYNMMATDVNGCTDTSAIPTSVFLSPTPSLSNSSNMCFGDSVLFTANAGSSQYNWLHNGTSVIVSGSNTFYASSGGNYAVETTFGGCIDTSASTSIAFAPQYDVTPTGSGSICIGSNQLLTATGGGSSYQWLMNGASIGGATSATFNATTTGAYACIITFPGCTDTTSTQYSLTAVDCSGIEENTTAVVSLYPNPVHTQLNISVSNDIIIQKIEVIDLSGRKVISTNTNSSNVSLNVETLRAGTYLISIVTENGVKTKRFIKN